MFNIPNITTPTVNKKQNRLASLYADSDEYEYEEPDQNEEGLDLQQQPKRVKKEHVNEYLDLLTTKEQAVKNVIPFDKEKFKKELGKVSKVGKRADKTVDKVKKTITDQYTFTNKDGIDLSKYREMLFDILINGNYRIKFSPKCATRKGAEIYCTKKFDKSGYPLYRLIPVRSDTTDPFGNAICDLNGDKVEDIVIVDRLGRPVIINGFKLVKANPYKKIWQTAIYNNDTNKPFEIWLRDLMNAKKTWNYTEEEWNEGKIKLDPENYDSKLKDAIKEYENVGLSTKPRVSSRLTARGLWASIFAKIWQVAIYSMFQDVVYQGETTYYTLLEPLKTLFSYFKVCSAIFIVKFETKIMESHNYRTVNENQNDNNNTSINGDWISWLRYKRNHQKEVNAELGLLIQKFYNEHVKAELPLNEDFKPDTKIKDEELNTLINNIFAIVFRYGLGFNDDESRKETFDKLAKLAEAIQNDEVSKRDKQELRQVFCDNIDIFIDQQVGGNYIKSKATYKERKDELVKKAGSYITARKD